MNRELESIIKTFTKTTDKLNKFITKANERTNKIDDEVAELSLERGVVFADMQKADKIRKNIEKLLDEE